MPGTESCLKVKVLANGIGSVAVMILGGFQSNRQPRDLLSSRPLLHISPAQPKSREKSTQSIERWMPQTRTHLVPARPFPTRERFQIRNAWFSRSWAIPCCVTIPLIRRFTAVTMRCHVAGSCLAKEFWIYVQSAHKSPRTGHNSLLTYLRV